MPICVTASRAILLSTPPLKLVLLGLQVRTNFCITCSTIPSFIRLGISYATQKFYLYMHDYGRGSNHGSPRFASVGFWEISSWSSKSPDTISHSSDEVECRQVANAVAKTCWLYNLPLKLHCPLLRTTMLPLDTLENDPVVLHECTKNIILEKLQWLSFTFFISI